MKQPVVICALLALFGIHSVQAQSATPISVNQRIERELSGQDVHAFSLSAEAGKFISGSADQISVDVVVNIIGPDGLEIAQFDSPARGFEPFYFNTNQAGAYRINISPFEGASGRYALTIDRLEEAATTREGQVDQMMAMYTEETPGSVAAVVRNGEVIFAKGYGMANLEYGIPNTAATVYHMASVSKQFTAFAVAILDDRGVLSMEDDVHKYIPELYDYGVPITLRNLLNHTSGIRDHWSLWTLRGGLMDDVIRQEDLLRLVGRQKELNFPPGSEYLYSNTGYMLLSEVVSRASGVPFGEWMEENVFGPLEMTSTQIYDDHRRIVKGRAYSYGNGPNGLQKSVLSYANSGATSLFTNASDLAKWLRNWRTGDVGGHTVLEKMQVQGILTNGDTLSYALGIGIGEFRGLRVIQHGGADAGYRTMLIYIPEIDAGVIVLGNIGTFDSGGMA